MFRQKLLIWTVHHTFLESRHPEVTKNLYHVLSTRHSQTPIFQAPVHGRYWGLKKISCRVCLLFIAFLVMKKQLLKSLLTCTFIRLLSNSFDLPSYSSKSRKKCTLRLLCCRCVSKCWGKVFLFFCEKLGRGLQETIASKQLNQRFWI